MWLSAFVELHNTDIPGAKFKIGDFVHYGHKELGFEGDGHVRAVNNVGDETDVFEYAVGGVINLLFYEDELTLVKELPSGQT